MTEQKILLQNLLNISRATINIYKVAGYKSPEFRTAMIDFAKALNLSRKLSEDLQPIVRDFVLVHEALARQNFHMLAYAGKTIEEKYVSKKD